MRKMKWCQPKGAAIFLAHLTSTVGLVVKENCQCPPAQLSAVQMHPAQRTGSQFTCALASAFSLETELHIESLMLDFDGFSRGSLDKWDILYYLTFTSTWCLQRREDICLGTQAPTFFRDQPLCRLHWLFLEDATVKPDFIWFGSTGLYFIIAGFLWYSSAWMKKHSELYFKCGLCKTFKTIINHT